MSATVRKLEPVVNTPTGGELLPVAEQPINPSSETRPIAWLVGAHGGAGTTTLATMFAPFEDAGRQIPAEDFPNTVILVGQAHKYGLRRLHEAILQFDSGQAGDAALVGVVLIHGVPGKVPRTLAGDIQRIRESAPSHNLWEIPYIEAWRTALHRELPDWDPSNPPAADPSAGKGKRGRAKQDPLRELPAEIRETAEDMFTRSLTAVKRMSKES